VNPEDESAALDFLVGIAKKREQLVPNWNYGELLAYAAGIIDGEGWIGMSRALWKHKKGQSSTYSLRVAVNMVTTKPIGLLHNLFGGTITTVNKGKYSPRNKLQYRWGIAVREDLERFLTLLEPRLIVKREQARLGLVLIQSLGKRVYDNELREAFCLKFKELNK